MNILALIPARMGSSRFPGKPLAKILGLLAPEDLKEECLEDTSDPVSVLPDASQ